MESKKGWQDRLYAQEQVAREGERESERGREGKGAGGEGHAHVTAADNPSLVQEALVLQVGATVALLVGHASILLSKHSFHLQRATAAAAAASSGSGGV
jgi:hypothetical protein